MSKHTPGPWIVTDNVNTHVIRGAEEPKVQGDIQFVFRDYVCSMWGGYHEANARLISQAPAMLAALEHVSACLSVNDYGDWVLLPAFDADRIDAAIRAAKGGA